MARLFVVVTPAVLHKRSSHGAAAAEARSRASKSVEDVADFMLDIREYDVPYPTRVSIDKKIFVAKWYNVVNRPGAPPVLKNRPDLLTVRASLLTEISDSARPIRHGITQFPPALVTLVSWSLGSYLLIMPFPCVFYFAAPRPCGIGMGYRNDKAASKVPEFRYGSDHDDIVGAPQLLFVRGIVGVIGLIW